MERLHLGHVHVLSHGGIFARRRVHLQYPEVCMHAPCKESVHYYNGCNRSVLLYMLYVHAPRSRHPCAMWCRWRLRAFTPRLRERAYGVDMALRGAARRLRFDEADEAVERLSRCVATLPRHVGHRKD